MRVYVDRGKVPPPSSSPHPRPHPHPHPQPHPHPSPLTPHPSPSHPQVPWPEPPPGSASSLPGALIAPALQDHDFAPLRKGDAMFVRADGEVLTYDGASGDVVHPVFVNEAAYYCALSTSHTHPRPNASPHPRPNPSPRPVFVNEAADYCAPRALSLWPEPCSHHPERSSQAVVRARTRTRHSTLNPYLSPSPSPLDPLLTTRRSDACLSLCSRGPLCSPCVTSAAVLSLCDVGRCALPV
jgi:hypothetical protein